MARKDSTDFYRWVGRIVVKIHNPCFKYLFGVVSQGYRENNLLLLITWKLQNFKN